MDRRVELRALRAEEVARFDEVRLATWQAAYRGLLPDAYLDARAVTEEMTQTRQTQLLDPDTALHVAAVDTGLVGVAAVRAARDDDLDREEVTELGALYVLPSHWRAGIGRPLMETALARRQRPVQVLWVLDGNARGRAFYEAAGFVPDGASRTLDLGGPVVEVRYRRST